MPRDGPCHHCGITKTPLWRNGPPDKPVLCNACGYRWMKKGSLRNYTPRHSRVAALGGTNDNEYAHEHKFRPKRKQENIEAISQNEHGEVGESSSTHEPSETGSTQPGFWESPIPTQKRTSLKQHNLSFIEKLTKDLHDILEKEPSLGQSEAPLIYKEEGDPNAYFETSLGCILMKRPIQSAAEDEAKDNSVSMKNKT